MEKLKVFISSKMAELRDAREVVGAALKERGIEAFVYEEKAGARPDSVVETSLEEVEKADLYVGLLWQKYGPVTVEEFRHAHEHCKPSLIYIRDKDIRREPELEDFLQNEVYDLQKGVTYDYFTSALDLGKAVARDVMAWLVREYRQKTALIEQAQVSAEEIERLRADVARLQAASKERLPQGSAVDILAGQLRAWFKAINYSLERYDHRGDDTSDLIVDIPTRRGYDRILVRAVEGEAKVHHLNALRTAVDEQRADEGWLVSVRMISSIARQEAEGHKDLFVYTFDELIDEQGDFSRYFAWLEKEVKDRGIYTDYVDLSATKDDIDPLTKEKLGTSRYERIDDYIDLWLDDPAKEHISILGEFGTGKTWFCLHYAWQALKKYKEAKAKGLQRPRLPIVIPLRDYSKAVSVESLFSEFFFRKHEIGLPGYSAFEQLNRMGKLLLIFDGFDEMADRINRQKQIDNFWELGKVVVPGAKAILTCRSEHFEFAKAAVRTFGGEAPSSSAADPRVLLEPPRFEVVKIEKLRPAQIREILVRSKGEDQGHALAERILEEPDLADLAQRPASIQFIIVALPFLHEGAKINLARVYLLASRELLLKNIREERTFTSMADKVYFLCELAWEMLSTGQLRLHYSQFPDRLRKYRPELAKKEYDHWKHDLEGQSLLVRDEEGNYIFAHKSLPEFFIAYKLAAEMGLFREDSEWITSFFPPDEPEPCPKPRRERWWREFFRCPYPDEDCPARETEKDGRTRCRRPAGTCISRFVPEWDLVNTVGARPLTPEVRGFLAQMVEEKDRLWDVIFATRGKTAREVNYTGGNAATMLRLLGTSFRRVQLAKTVLMGADLTNADLTGARLSGAVLRSARLSNASLEGAILSKADLTDVWFDEMRRVSCLAWSPDGSYLASGGEDGSIRIWDSHSWRVVTSSGLEQQVLDIGWGRTGFQIVACDRGGKSMIWNVEEEQIRYLKPALERPIFIALSPAMDLAYGVDRYGTLAIWDTNTGTLIYQQQQYVGRVLSADMHPDGGYLALGTNEGLVAFVNLDMGVVTGRLEAEKGSPVRTLCFSPTGNHIVTPADRGFDVFQFSTEEESSAPLVSRFPVEGWERPGISRTIALCYSPTGHLLAVMDTEGHIDIFEIDVVPVRRWGLPDRFTRLWSSGRWQAVEPASLCFAPHGDWFAFSRTDSRIILLNARTGELVKELEQRINCEHMRIGGAIGLDAPAPSGKGTLREWLVERGAVD